MSMENCKRKFKELDIMQVSRVQSKSKDANQARWRDLMANKTGKGKDDKTMRSRRGHVYIARKILLLK